MKRNFLRLTTITLLSASILCGCENGVSGKIELDEKTSAAVKKRLDKKRWDTYATGIDGTLKPQFEIEKELEPSDKFAKQTIDTQSWLGEKAEVDAKQYKAKVFLVAPVDMRVIEKPKETFKAEGYKEVVDGQMLFTEAEREKVKNELQKKGITEGKCLDNLGGMGCISRAKVKKEDHARIKAHIEEMINKSTPIKKGEKFQPKDVLIEVTKIKIKDKEEIKVDINKVEVN